MPPSERTLARYRTAAPPDPSPEFTVELVRDERGIGHFDHRFAFDPRYGPEHESQIEYHEAKGHWDTTDWEVGQPVQLRLQRRAA